MLKKMYQADGVTLNTGYSTAHVLTGTDVNSTDISDWDDLIVAQRKLLHQYCLTLGLVVPSWTKGNKDTLDPNFQVGVKADAFYISHVDDLKLKIIAVETKIKSMIPSYTLTVWTYPVGALVPRYDANGDDTGLTWTDARTALILDEILNAMDRISVQLGGQLVQAPGNVSVEFGDSNMQIGA